MKKLIFLFFLFGSFLFAQNSDLVDWLKTVDGIEFKEIHHDSLYFNAAYEIFVDQPLDHFSETSQHFKQQVFLSFKGKNRPMIIDTEGYSAHNRTLELSPLLNANQLVVEHRYFEESVPDSLDWRYLTTRQAAADHHRIVQIFKRFFTGKWVSTGISKGGQTTIFFRYYYPDDVDVSVPYVAPLNFSDADPRIHSFLESVSTQECRERVFEYQKLLLKRRAEIMPLFVKYCSEKKYDFSISLDAAFEYSVLEFSFSFWQWGRGGCGSLPDSTADAEELFAQMKNFGIIGFISDRGVDSILPFYYQAFTEIGFYDYDVSKFGSLIKYSDGSNKIFYDPDWKISFNSSLMHSIKSWLDTAGNNFIYIYGENDPWSATSVELSGKTNSVKIVNPGGAHWSRISSLPKSLKGVVYSKLEEWLGVSIEPAE